MKVCVLASGSKGNCVYIDSNGTKLLMDVGISNIQVEKRLNEINVNSSDIDAVFITHTHSDHINGLKVFAKKNNAKIYMREKAYQEVKDLLPININFINDEIVINDTVIKTIKTSHDATDSVSYLVEDMNSSCVYMTDTGYIKQKNLNQIKNKDIYIFESNHDIEMLLNGEYPYHLKQRILGDSGHLSNKDSAVYMTKLLGDNTKKVILFHLSDKNNTKKLALETYEEVFKNHDIEIPNIIVAEQNEVSELIEV